MRAVTPLTGRGGERVVERLRERLGGRLGARAAERGGGERGAGAEHGGDGGDERERRGSGRRRSRIFMRTGTVGEGL